MSFVKPQFSRSQVSRAGDILISPDSAPTDLAWAMTVLSNWRAAHGYPINTFQATLRHRLKSIDANALVAQRMKRLPSILAKLKRFNTMKLAQMQDIGGLRAVVSSMSKVRQIESLYREVPFEHTLVPSKDYILEPKNDGYRSVHLIFKYKNRRAPDYDGLLLELQIRTKIQHAWATAVETMGTFLGQALKSGQGDASWKRFFKITSSALAIIEDTSAVPGFEGLSRHDIFTKVAEAEMALGVLSKLSGFSVAADHVTEEKGKGHYHLVVLNYNTRRLRVTPYPKNRLDKANEDYASIEQRVRDGENLEAVLVSAGPISALKRAYPNYFLDTQAFINQVKKIVAEVT